MANWYLYTITALLAFGIQRFLYKVSAEMKCNTAWTTFSFMGTVALLSSFFFVLAGESVINLPFLFFISLINSISFLAGTITTIEALKYISMSVAYPIIRLNTGIVVTFSIIYFKDALSVFQITGMLIAITVIVLLTRHNSDQDEIVVANKQSGFVLVFVALFSGAVAAISSKFAAIHTNHLGFIALSYTMSTLFALALKNHLQRNEGNPHHRNALIIGFFIGLVNFAGFYCLVKALSLGPLSLISAIIGMYFVIAIILSAIIYRERLSWVRIAGITMTVLSIMLMRL